MLVSLCLFLFAMKYVSAVVFEPGSQPKWTFMYSRFVIIIFFAQQGLVRSHVFTMMTLVLCQKH